MEFHQIYTLDQITDMKCIALNQLPTLYIRYSLDMLAATSQKKLMQYNEMVAAAVENAEKMIANDRRERKDDFEDIVVYRSKDRFQLEDEEESFSGKLNLD
ncbi:late competence development ComFB family protein [Aliivibrio sp. S10_S31]|uniref:late competence development ComFB family protein n=1 Tax=Aliivibrio sp. S10_S31 TaxID=2720224 RepID=UPI001EEF7517|nr:late competence development ComFB family protein [Aliivibrio sp. S10_S31]